MTYSMRLSMLLAIVLHAAVASAQADWHWTQRQYTGDSVSINGGVHTSVGFESLSNVINNETMRAALNGQLITQEMTASIATLEADGSARLNAATRGDFWVRLPGDKTFRLLIGAGYYDGVMANTRVGLAQLVLRGNSGSDGDGSQLTLGPSKVRYFSYQHVGGGVEFQSKASTFGATASLIKCSRYSSLALGYSELNTAMNGTSINGFIDLEYITSASTQPKSTAWYGTGGKIDAYYVFQPKAGGPLMSMALNDLGVIHFEGTQQWRFRDSIQFTGIETNDILALDDSLAAGGSIDSLGSLIGFEQGHQAISAWLPINLELQYLHPITDKLSARIGLRQYLRGPGPRITAAMAYLPKPWLSVEPVVQFGGYTRFDLGLNASVLISNQVQLALFAMMFEPLVSPTNSTSQAIAVKANVRF